MALLELRTLTIFLNFVAYSPQNERHYSILYTLMELKQKFTKNTSILCYVLFSVLFLKS